MSLPPSEMAQIHRALNSAQGTRAEAAAALNLTPAELEAKIDLSPELQAYWRRGAEPPTSAAAYDRNRPTIRADQVIELQAADLGVTPRAAAIAAAVEAQEGKAQRFDWEGLGVNDQKTLALMRQFEGNGIGRGVLKMMDAMQGGMAFCFAQVSRQLADVTELLQAERAKPEDQRDEGRIQLYHQQFMDLSREVAKFNKEATNAGHMRLLIADRAKKIQQSQNRMKKPTLRRVAQEVGRG